MPKAGLSTRLRTHVHHVQAIGSGHDAASGSSTPHRFAQAAGHIEITLLRHGYQLRRQDAAGQELRHIEVSLSNLAPGAWPERIFIIGAHLDVAPAALAGAPGADEGGSGTAAVLELARLLKAMRPSRGTEVKFVFFVNGEPPSPGLEQRYRGAGNFIAFVGTLESSARVRQVLAAFTEHPGLPAEGLAAPAHTMGATLLDHGAHKLHAYPALTITNTAFLRYPYHRTVEHAHDRCDYAAIARVVEALARTIESLAGAMRM